MTPTNDFQDDELFDRHFELGKNMKLTNDMVIYYCEPYRVVGDIVR